VRQQYVSGWQRHSFFFTPDLVVLVPGFATADIAAFSALGFAAAFFAVAFFSSLSAGFSAFSAFGFAEFLAVFA
jgi:hypothetical protein